MKTEAIGQGAQTELALPDDFARRVIERARLEQRRQRLRRRAFAVAIVVLAVMPLARPSQRVLGGAWRTSMTPAVQASGEAYSDQLTDDFSRDTPEQVSDYLAPDVAPLRSLAAYSEASWDYDPSWSDYR